MSGHPGSMIQRLCVLLGGLAGAAGVAMAAVAAHGLGALTPVALAAVHSAVEMQVWHAIALLGVAAWLPRGGVMSRAAAVGFVVGIVLFCGGVYGHELAGLPVGVAAPIGGTILIVAWVALAGSALRR
jgi:uncharacterized membrane protein YgdD (TMEM256/DUF423 family)